MNVDNNDSLEKLIRPWAVGRRAWLFAGSALAGQRAAIDEAGAICQAARTRFVGLPDYLNDGLTRLPTRLNSRIDELLPHNWHPAR